MRKFLLVTLLLTAFGGLSTYSQPLFPCSERLEAPYGLCSHISRPSTEYPLRRQNLEAMQKLGVKWVRSDLDWYTVMKDNDRAFDPTVFDSTLAACRQHDVQWLPILDRGNRHHLSWDNIPAYLQYVKLLGNHYRNRLTHWEVINEANLIGNTPKEELGRKYAGVLRAVYSELKAISPDCQVVYGGQGEVFDDGFLEVACQEEAYRYMDIMNFHTYRSPEELPASFLRIHSMMKKYGWSKPVWLTETGFHTLPPTTPNHHVFYEQVLPEAMRRIGLKASRCRIAIVYDMEMLVPAPTADELKYFSSFKEVKLISASEVQDIDPERYPILIPSYGESFPAEYADAVLRYVKEGGTLICPRGVPFYFNTSVNGAYTVRGKNTLQQDLHLSLQYWWGDYDGVKVPEIPTWCKQADGMPFTYGWKFDKTRSARFLTDHALKPGDRMTPLVQAGNDSFTGTVAALYQFNSDLKGNIIVQTRIDDESRTLAEQARRLPRAFLISFAYGVDRVFWYHLRAFEKDYSDPESFFGILHRDFSERPAYVAMKTLVSLCPHQSTRPQLTVDGNKYRAEWNTPDGKRICALWTIDKPYSIKLSEKPLSVLNHLGEQLSNKKKIEISDGVTYLVYDK